MFQNNNKNIIDDNVLAHRILMSRNAFFLYAEETQTEEKEEESGAQSVEVDNFKAKQSSLFLVSLFESSLNERNLL